LRAAFAAALDCIATRTGESAPGQTGGCPRTPCSPGCWTSRHYTACSRSASSPGLRITRIRWHRLTVMAA